MTTCALQGVVATHATQGSTGFLPEGLIGLFSVDGAAQ